MGDPVQKILRSTYIIAWQGPYCSDAVSPSSSTTTFRDRDECPFGASTGPPRAYVVGGPHTTTAPSVSDHCVPAALAATARFRVQRGVWFNSGYVFMHLSAESVGTISHVFCVKVDSGREVDTLFALEGVVLLYALVFSALLTTSDVSTHANLLSFAPELKSCGAANGHADALWKAVDVKLVRLRRSPTALASFIPRFFFFFFKKKKMEC